MENYRDDYGEKEFSVQDYQKEFNDGYVPDNAPANIDFPKADGTPISQETITIHLENGTPLEIKRKRIESDVIKAFAKEHIEIEELYHADGAPRPDLSTPGASGGAACKHSDQRLYLGDFIRSYKGSGYFFGITDKADCLDYRPEENGHLLICSNDPEQIRHSIETLITHMHCTKPSGSDEVYVIDLYSRISGINSSPLIKSFASDISEAFDTLTLVKNMIDYRAAKVKKAAEANASVAELENCRRDRVFVVIPELPYPETQEDREALALIDTILIRSEKVGVHFIIGSLNGTNDQFVSKISNSVGRIIRFKPRHKTGKVIILAEPDSFEYTGTGYRNRGHALQVSTSDTGLIASLKSESDALEEYSELIDVALHILNKRSDEKYDIKLEMVKFLNDDRKVEKTLAMLEKINYIKRDGGKIIPLIPQEDMVDTAM